MPPPARRSPPFSPLLPPTQSMKQQQHEDEDPFRRQRQPQFLSQSTMMNNLSTILLSLALLFSGASALAPNKVHHTKKPAFDSKRVAFNGMAVASLASALVVGPMADAVEMVAAPPSFGSSSLIAERVTREGLYREYDVDLGDQQFDDARSTYKSAKETKTKKGKYTALIAVLVVGSFIIPMAQYFWYVRDDDSSDKFFSKAQAPEPTPEPKKKGWFNK